MARKDISDIDVLHIFNNLNKIAPQNRVGTLMQITGQPKKVVWRAIERTCDKGYLEYGVSLRTAWLTEEGEALLRGGNVDENNPWS